MKTIISKVQKLGGSSVLASTIVPELPLRPHTTDKGQFDRAINYHELRSQEVFYRLNMDFNQLQRDLHFIDLVQKCED